jgi:hypothetical protein
VAVPPEAPGPQATVVLGIPLVLFASITGLVYALTSRERPRPPDGPPVGITPAPQPCDVVTDADGHEVHEPASGESDRPPCWTLAYAECATAYREGENDVHFTHPDQAVTVACSRGWVLAGHRMRCRRRA